MSKGPGSEGPEGPVSMDFMDPDPWTLGPWDFEDLLESPIRIIA